MPKQQLQKISAIIITILIIALFTCATLARAGYENPLFGDVLAIKFAVGDLSMRIVLQGEKSFAFTELLAGARALIVSGYITTLSIVFWTAIVSVIFGWILFIAMRMSGWLLWIKYIAKLIHDFVLAIPLIVLIVIIYYFIAPTFNLHDPFFVGIYILSIYSSVYIYQVYEAAIQAIPVSQIEGAKMLGMTNFQTYRYIIIPQMLRFSLPPLVGQLSGIIKNSALLSYVAISEFTNVMNQLKASTFIVFESYVVLALGYLILTIPLVYLVKKYEQKLRGERAWS
ncbi:MAG: amino acid ABC transporter permease [Mycoplasmatales bacterium]